MADATDFVRVDFGKLLVEPDGFEIGLSPLPDGMCAVRLRTKRGVGLRELKPQELQEFLSRFLEAIGAGRISMAEEFNFEAFKEAREEELIEIEAQLKALKARKTRIVRELTVVRSACSKLAVIDGKPKPAETPGGRVSDLAIEWLSRNPGMATAKTIAAAIDRPFGSVAVAMAGCARSGRVKRNGDKFSVAKAA